VCTLQAVADMSVGSATLSALGVVHGDMIYMLYE
jgi:hypothetical protein